MPLSKRLTNEGVTVDEIEGHLKRSMAHRSVAVDEKWNYFCGCCWRTVRERHAMARDLIAIGEV